MLVAHATFNQIHTIFSQLPGGLHSAFNSSSPDNNPDSAGNSMNQLQTPVRQLMHISLN